MLRAAARAVCARLVDFGLDSAGISEMLAEAALRGALQSFDER